MNYKALPNGITLQLLLCNKDTDSPEKVIFFSSKKWLHPLFELEEFLTAHVHSSEPHVFKFDGGLRATSVDFLLRDRIIGRAAAFLILRLGILRVETELVSRRALALLAENHISIKALETVDAIDCLTEELLKNIYDPTMAAQILAERRILALAKIK
jgi:hypothetical protein